ncbi:MAG: RDD family protein, partial [Peptostreptococcaceae bacterium]
LGSLIFSLYIVLAPVVFKGYHFGKYMMGMKIVKNNYDNPSFINIIIRELSKMIYTIPFIGIILVLISNYMMNAREDGKAIHDIIARTKVINV